ncbi:type IV secretion system protein [Vibrio sp. K4]|uniref:type IV secretion system protein n=1 Tax=Vibrio sp. K4 TaxID=3391579 RepID=UPI003DA6F7B0
MFKRSTFTLTLSLILATPAYAGIPVIDVAGITQMITDSTARAHEFTQSITEARNRLNQMKNQAEHYKSMVEGHYSFEDILTDPNLNDIIDLSDYSDLYDAVDDISDLRDEFGLKSDDPLVQRRYDMQLKQFRFQEMLYERSAKRSERMSRLLGQFETATTPAAKEDLGNSINFEQIQMQNDQQMMVAMSDMLERQKQLETEQRLNDSYQKFMYGDGIAY